MAHPEWPAELPRPERDSWQNQLQDSRQKRVSEAGPPGWARRFSSAARLVTLSLILSRNQKAIFDRFYEQDCAGGVRLFWMPDPTTDGWEMLSATGETLLDGAGNRLLLSARWLCRFGDQVPVESIAGQVEFRKRFNVVVLP